MHVLQTMILASIVILLFVVIIMHKIPKYRIGMIVHYRTPGQIWIPVQITDQYQKRYIGLFHDRWVYKVTGIDITNGSLRPRSYYSEIAEYRLSPIKGFEL